MPFARLQAARFPRFNGRVGDPSKWVGDALISESVLETFRRVSDQTDWPRTISETFHRVGDEADGSETRPPARSPKRSRFRRPFRRHFGGLEINRTGSRPARSPARASKARPAPGQRGLSWHLETQAGERGLRSPGGRAPGQRSPGQRGRRQSRAERRQDSAGVPVVWAARARGTVTGVGPVKVPRHGARSRCPVTVPHHGASLAGRLGRGAPRRGSARGT